MFAKRTEFPRPLTIEETTTKLRTISNTSQQEANNAIRGFDLSIQSKALQKDWVTGISTIPTLAHVTEDNYTVPQ